jgi:hypothetical protein
MLGSSIVLLLLLLLLLLLHRGPLGQAAVSRTSFVACPRCCCCCCC